ncbi:MAG: SUMF1/EgtB/PvdO family nonheme iron enzyme [Magnetococcales bacterium]|nr:SUMF1/EgtB/PvdO family nonheme iron enzyme [Magnetococcales bacterium]
MVTWSTLIPWPCVANSFRQWWIWDDGPKGSNRVNRGGSWNNNPANVRSANRNNNDPGNRNNNLGFRLASTTHSPDRAGSRIVPPCTRFVQAVIPRRCGSPDEEKGSLASGRPEQVRRPPGTASHQPYYRQPPLDLAIMFVFYVIPFSGRARRPWTQLANPGVPEELFLERTKGMVGTERFRRPLPDHHRVANPDSWIGDHFDHPAGGWLSVTCHLPSGSPSRLRKLGLPADRASWTSSRWPGKRPGDRYR